MRGFSNGEGLKRSGQCIEIIRYSKSLFEISSVHAKLVNAVGFQSPDIFCSSSQHSCPCIDYPGSLTRPSICRVFCHNDSLLCQTVKYSRRLQNKLVLFTFLAVRRGIVILEALQFLQQLSLLLLSLLEFFKHFISELLRAIFIIAARNPIHICVVQQFHTDGSRPACAAWIASCNAFTLSRSFCTFSRKL